MGGNEKEEEEGLSTLDKVQFGLDMLGNIPIFSVPTGLISASIDIYKGDYGSAAFNLVTMLPGAKLAATAVAAGGAVFGMAKVVKKVVKVGKRGGPAHIKRVAEAEQRMKKVGLEHIAGGTKKERKFGDRYPDLVFQNTNNGDKIAIQVGKTTKGGLPVIRERRAMQDLQQSGDFKHVFFLKY